MDLYFFGDFICEVTIKCRNLLYFKFWFDLNYDQMK